MCVCVCVCVYIVDMCVCACIYVLLGFRKKIRKKRKLVEQVYWINGTYIQSKSFTSAGRSVRSKLSISTVGIKSVFVIRPTDWASVAQGFFRLFRAAPKIPHAPLVFPKKMRLREPGYEPNPSKEGYSLGVRPPETLEYRSRARPTWMPDYRNPCQTTSTDCQRS